MAREDAHKALHAARANLAAAGPRPSAPSGVVVALGGLVVTGLACGHPVSHVVAAFGTPAWEAALIGAAVGMATAVLPVSVMLSGRALDTTFDRAAWGSLVVGSALSVALFELGTSEARLLGPRPRGEPQSSHACGGTRNAGVRSPTSPRLWTD